MCILCSSLRCRPRNVSEIRFRRSAVTGIPLLFSDIRFLASSLKHPFLPLFHAVRVMSFRWFGVPLPPLFMLYPFSRISDRFSRIQNFSRSFSSSCVLIFDSSTTHSNVSSPYFRIAAWKTQRSRLLRAAARCSRRRFPNLVVVWPMYHFSVTVFLTPYIIPSITYSISNRSVTIYRSALKSSVASVIVIRDILTPVSGFS